MTPTMETEKLVKIHTDAERLKSRNYYYYYRT
ncbi:unnamed protein product [Arabidopsis thaliana]|uniref:Uncharacterized protein n=3 Tax=Arabidopsis TaxID=3701 RepID=A0A654G7C5_ARATH|nr:uncharacterized protein AT5G40981 [Arabidopsis thaliana]AED94622.1 hypothetical protein AT5G40981 [Arabidopsis thaliana]KAG7611401.1 hypothetical protein ISN44_As05g035020 [Arabidopsis suecica]CAA0406667.1 unnamed protein product [Arabidopsis thaliana]VYS68886.1 unnamed protein product [Arabidopsis thaliana]|eukprot:NP_001318720.1 hypothetical protein AT5G40981 [Arabidopsis thaliana]